MFEWLGKWWYQSQNKEIRERWEHWRQIQETWHQTSQGKLRSPGEPINLCHIILNTASTLMVQRIFELRKIWCLVHLHESQLMWICKKCQAVKLWLGKCRAVQSRSLITDQIALPVHRGIMMPCSTLSRNKMYKSLKWCTKNAFKCDDSQALKVPHLVNFHVHLYFLFLSGICVCTLIKDKTNFIIHFWKIIIPLGKLFSPS